MFENIKVGDSLYDVCYGWGRVKSVNFLDYSDEVHFLEVEFSHMKKFTYSKKGINLDLGCKNQTLFWDEVKIEVPEKPFDLEDELRKLKIKEFVLEEENIYLAWSNQINKISYFYSNIYETPFLIYFNLDSVLEFLKRVKEKKITKKQFFEAYKNVFFGGRND